MVRKISEFSNSEPVFENAEQVKVDELMGKVIVIKGYAVRQGETGDFFVINAVNDGEDVCFSNGGRVIMDKLGRIAQADEITPDDKKVVMFKEPVEAKIIQTKSKEGRLYYDLIDSDAIPEENVKAKRK